MSISVEKKDKKKKKSEPDGNGTAVVAPPDPLFQRRVLSVRPRSAMLVPPINFAMVSTGIYRSGYPNARNIDFLARLGLRAVLYLGLEDQTPDHRRFVSERALAFHRCPLQGNIEPFVEIPVGEVAAVLRLLLAPENHPILLHCDKGTHRTGCVVGCLRKIQGWALSSIVDEYAKFTGAHPPAMDLQFIELFDPHILQPQAAGAASGGSAPQPTGAAAGLDTLAKLT